MTFFVAVFGERKPIPHEGNAKPSREIIRRLTA